MRLIYFFKGDNSEVIDCYFSIIEVTFRRKGWNVIYVSTFDELKKLNKESYVFIAELRHSIPLIIRGFRNIVYWNQGTTPDEDFMRRQSYFRKILLRLCEYVTFRRSKLLFFVSNYMLDYYEQLYSMKLCDKCFIMPCFNTSLCIDSFVQEKYDHNIFCYVGSLAKWQCFEKTLTIYKKIEADLEGKCSLKIYTNEQRKADETLKSFNIKNYEIDYIPPQLLHRALSKCKYGFIIREDNVVNNVATPTKMSTYLANGVIPIFSDCIVDFKKWFADKKYFVCLQDNQINNFYSQKINAEDVLTEYQNVFSTYYNRKLYEDSLLDLIDKLSFD